MKAQEVRRSMTDVFQIVNNNIRLYKERCLEKNVHLISYVKEKTIIETDSEILDTILRNLISNAIKFSKEGGRVIINYKLKNQYIMISVEDNGTGMDKRMQELLFKTSGNISTYGTFKEKGTGIGLILCFELLKKLKGKIYVKSEPGKGSAFTFTIPLEIYLRNSKKEQKKRFISHLFNL
jgi:signal transduction histidine kinase